MRSGHVGHGRTWLAWIVFYAGFCAATAHAQSPVVCAGIGDPQLVARIHGQTRDLPVNLIQASDPVGPKPSAQQLQAIADRHAADFVVSVEARPHGARRVYVYDARRHELRVRTAPAPDKRNRFARSAAAETVAVIVRGELADALAMRTTDSGTRATAVASAAAPSTETQAGPPNSGAALERASQNADTSVGPGGGAAVSSRPAPSEPSAHTTEERDSPERPRNPRRPEGQRDQDDNDHPQATESVSGEVAQTGPEQQSWWPPMRISFELAGRLSTPNAGRVFFGPALALRCSLENVSVGIVATTSLRDRSVVQNLAITLQEKSLGLEVLGHFRLLKHLRAGVGAAGRWFLYAREATSNDPTWQPEPPHTSSSFAVGPVLELRLQLLRHLGLALRTGADVLFRPLSWGYRRTSDAHIVDELERQRRWEPYSTLGIYGTLDPL